MKTFSPGLLAFLQENTTYNRADLFSITLPNGRSITAAASQYDITYNGQTFYATKYGQWERGKITSEAAFDLRANEMTLTVIVPGTISYPSPPSLTQLFTDPLNGSNLNPINPANWTTWTGESPCQILNHECVSTVTGTSRDGAYYSGATLPPDQYVQVQIAALNTNDPELAIYLRANAAQSSGYLAIIGASGNGLVTVGDLIGGVYADPVPGIIFRPADTFGFGVIGTTLVLYQNNKIIWSGNNSLFASGFAGFDLGAPSAVTDVGITNFAAGSLSGTQTAVTLMGAAQLGLFDAALVQVWTAYWPIGQQPNSYVSQWGVETKYAGYIKPNGSIARSKLQFEVTDALYRLNQKLPRNLLQASCRHTLFDNNEYAIYGTRTNCTLNPNNFASGIMTVAAGSTRVNIITTGSLGQAAPYFSQGYITFLTGENAGLTFTVKAQVSTTNLVLAAAVPLPLAIGDTFTAFAGCDKSQATCNSKFSNLIHFGGTPFVPNPEVAI